VQVSSHAKQLASIRRTGLGDAWIGDSEIWVLGIGWIYYREGLAEAVGGDVSFVPAWSVGKS